jgi:hypothetical protein
MHQAESAADNKLKEQALISPISVEGCKVPSGADIVAKSAGNSSPALLNC